MRYLALLGLGLALALLLGLSYSGLSDIGGKYIAAAQVHGVRTVYKFGQNPDVDAATDEDVWDCPEIGANTVYPFPAAAQTIYVSSDDATDVGIPIVVSGLDANWELQENAVGVLNGLATVEVGTGLTWMRVWRGLNGGGTALTGNVYIHLDSDAGADGIPDTPLTDIIACIRIGEEQTLMAIFTTPMGYTSYITQADAHLAAAATGGVDLVGQGRNFGGVFRTGLRASITSGADSIIALVFDPPQMVPAKTDFKIRADSTANNNNVTGTFNVVMTRD